MGSSWPGAYFEDAVTPRPWSPVERDYRLRAYGYLPVTFVRRVLLGRDPYWRRYFWSRWGYVPDAARAPLRGGPVLWIEALSGGEVTQIVTFCRRLRAALPGHRLVLSTNNRYSHEFAATTVPVHAIVDSPWDCPGPVRRALAATAPAAVVAVENLTSPVLFREAHRRGITTLLVSGLMSKDFGRHPMNRRTMIWRPFRWVDRIGAKSEEDVRGFIGAGASPDRVAVTGNMKFDVEYLRSAASQRSRYAEHFGFGAGAKVLLGASLHPGEERFLAEAFLAARNDVEGLELVLVPRYRFHVKRMQETLQSLGLSSVRKTELGRDRRRPGQAVIVDTFGELGALYAIASVAFIGGSTYLRSVIGAGQNIVEPLVQRVPVLFGPYMNLWREITDELKKICPAIEVASAGETATALRTLFGATDVMTRLRDTAGEIVARHAGDVQRNVDLVVAAVAGGKPVASVRR